MPPSLAHAEPAPLTHLLTAVRDGEAGATDALARAVYDELRTLAAGHLRRERADHTLQPTALVHEAYLRLFGGAPVDWRNRAHFFGMAARVMRQVLVDHARRAQTTKRDGGVPVALDDVIGLADGAGAPLDVLRVHDALESLAALDARQARVVELRFFVGLTLDETAAVLGVSPVTVSREWAMARAWLAAELRDG
ncbi:DNA-directed RNA polymerase sigma-70 factor [Gemmatimonadetes bacterium T265]|nr:DNA-directed RNA polymerase sigma-70 factor [Gemmatimonadetes bacterium T265]